MNIKSLKQFVVLSKQKKELEAQISKIKTDMLPLEEKILEDFCKENINNIKVDDRVVYMNIIEYAKKCENVTAQQAVVALEKSGLDEFISYNTQSLSAECRRWQEEGIDSPSELKDIIEMVPQFSIRVRKS